MAIISHPPHRLTPELCEAIEDNTRDVIDTGDGPSSPIDWVARYAGVKKLTIRRWMREGVSVRQRGLTGPIARKWIRFADAVDALVAACANSVCDTIAEIARDAGDKKRLDALLALQKRIDRHEAELDAVDLDIGKNESVAHIPRDVLDALTDEEIAAITTAQEAMNAARELVNRTLEAAQDRLVDVGTDLAIGSGGPTLDPAV
jgi:hypothetical protein